MTSRSQWKTDHTVRGLLPYRISTRNAYWTEISWNVVCLQLISQLPDLSEFWTEHQIVLLHQGRLNTRYAIHKGFTPFQCLTLDLKRLHWRHLLGASLRITGVSVTSTICANLLTRLLNGWKHSRHPVNSHVKWLAGSNDSELHASQWQTTCTRMLWSTLMVYLIT